MVRSGREAAIGTRLSGQVKSIPVSAGDAVAEGALLVEIDSRDLALQFEAAERRRESAKSAWDQAGTDLARLRRIHEDELIPVSQVEQAELREEETRSALAAAQAEVTSLSTQMDYARITAPFSGVVSDVLTDQGSLAAPGVPLVVLEDRNNLEVRAKIDEKSMLRLNPGDELEVRLPGLDTMVGAIVHSFIPALEEPGAGSTIKVRLKDPPPGTRPGMIAQIRTFALEKPREVVIVPKDALLVRGQMNGVFVITRALDVDREIQPDTRQEVPDPIIPETHRARLRWVHLAGPLDGTADTVAIDRGLEAGELVVVGPEIDTLRDDQVVKIAGQWDK